MARETRGAWDASLPSAIRVAVSASDPLVLAGLGAIITSAPSLDLVGRAATADERGRREAQVLVRTLDDLDQRGFGPIPTVVIATVLTDAELLDLLRAGAAGVLLHRAAADLLEVAVRTATGGGCVVDPHLAPRLVAMAARGERTSDPDELTVQQQRVVTLVARDLTNRQIAEHLGLSTHTVKSHLRSAMRKLGAVDRHHASELLAARPSPGADRR
ncbi:MAG: LuxR C-terminal-related transcriptional regulator [Egibacteraceae bacterium]